MGATSKKRETVKELKARIKELEESLKEKEDALLRAYADYQNYQRRVQKEINEISIKSKMEIAKELVDVYELLQKAMEDEDPREGLKSIMKKIKKIFEKEDIKPIECIGKPFDYNLHHAISVVHRKGKDNIVVDEVKKGYTMKGKLLRPSLVVVSKEG